MDKIENQIMLQVSLVYACNFKCKYCSFSFPKKNRNFILNKTRLNLNLYKKCLNEVASKSKIKTIRFSGLGEPLLHTHLTDMIKYAKNKNIAESMEITTNGSLLNFDLSDRLIHLGIGKFIIYVQGMSEEHYKKMTGVDIYMKQFLAELNYLNKNKENAKVYIKMFDSVCNDEKMFHKIFDGLCDEAMLLGYAECTDSEDDDILSQRGDVLQIIPDGRIIKILKS